MTMPGNEFLDQTQQGFGAYLCARSTGTHVDAAALAALCTRLGLLNEFEGKPMAGESVAFLRRDGASPAPSPTTTCCTRTSSFTSRPVDPASWTPSVKRRRSCSRRRAFAC